MNRDNEKRRRKQSCVARKEGGCERKGGGDWNEEVRFVYMRPANGKMVYGKSKGTDLGQRSRESKWIMIVSINQHNQQHPQDPRHFTIRIFHDPPTFEQKTEYPTRL